jgi:hypothetical protein
MRTMTDFLGDEDLPEQSEPVDRACRSARSSFPWSAPVLPDH